MKYRSPLKVALFTIFSFGIYILFWYVKTKGELNARGGEIPTAWIWLIPIFGYFYWIYKYSEAVDKVTNQKLSLPLAFILVWFIGGGIGEAILGDAAQVAAPIHLLCGQTEIRHAAIRRGHPPAHSKVQ